MSDPLHTLGTYLYLVQASQRRFRPLVRGRMLVLAGAVASDLQLDALANYCRVEILKHNPHHLIARWPSFADAMMHTEFISLLRQLRRRFPLEKAERMLETLGVETSHHEEDYGSVLEYAAAILDVNLGLFDRDS